MSLITTTHFCTIATTINDPDFLPQKLKDIEINLNLIMSTASAEKPDSGAYVEILKVARQIQHLAHFLSQGPPFAGNYIPPPALRAEFPREWVEDDGALAIVLHDWREQVGGMKQSNTNATEEKPDQVADLPTEADIEVDSDVSFLSYPMKREAHWVEMTKELEKKLRQSEQEKQSAMQHNLKLQLEVEALQRKAQSLYQALFDPDNRIHEANVMAKVKLHGEIRQLKKSLDAANSKNESLVKKNKDLESCNKGLITENEELVKSQELESSNKDLVTENEAFAEENRDIDSDNGDLFATNQDLLTKIALARDAAKSYKELLTAKSWALESSNKVLAKEITALKTSNQCVVAKSSKLKERFEQSVIATKSCKERLDKIASKVKELGSSKNALAAQNKDLMNRNAALADTNRRLEESLKKIVTDAKYSLQSLS
ncbi:hypothetical protein BFJ63_vAg3411 [Fusarium oxysporum f. sp. narcissi]|uniref:Uncharacterized protein n=1 Tax=Fusarium oxysporum f. sp. narcissi TaxID=451672 RepID=A0A4Q2W3K2_FUSOX|nr:hypothetical protein FOWG_11844 [Fusarium oxysporum f. sp. lycopersici MN25]KAJ4123928.1 hypothetical protein NW765_006973 [Fusarium oxysporum]KAJ4271094.1 hypothetical protein NW764_013459 [Fusarium oxysporum]RKL52225.1 hypothetical protein BFJ70_g938 [Fusarium oxysporum]RYC93773.1 hypothetical protein BFJ63_vAg3411 [Fusarium oxysporum f. sp. narcissi]